MKVTFEAMRHDAFTKALYAVLVDGQKVGTVAHRKVDQTTRYVQMVGPRGSQTMARRTRRSRPLAWVAQGTVGRQAIREVRRTREAATDALLEALGIEVEARVEADPDGPEDWD